MPPASRRSRGDASSSWAFWKPLLIYSYDHAAQASNQRAAAVAAAAGAGAGAGTNAAAAAAAAAAADSGAEIAGSGAGSGGGAARAHTSRGASPHRTANAGVLGSEDDALVFDSLFESGNLDYA